MKGRFHGREDPVFEEVLVRVAALRERVVRELTAIHVSIQSRGDVLWRVRRTAEVKEPKVVRLLEVDYLLGDDEPDDRDLMDWFAEEFPVEPAGRSKWFWRRDSRRETLRWMFRKPVMEVQS